MKKLEEIAKRIKVDDEDIHMEVQVVSARVLEEKQFDTDSNLVCPNRSPATGSAREIVHRQQTPPPILDATKDDQSLNDRMDNVLEDIVDENQMKQYSMFPPISTRRELNQDFYFTTSEFKWD